MKFGFETKFLFGTPDIIARGRENSHSVKYDTPFTLGNYLTYEPQFRLLWNEYGHFNIYVIE